MINKKLGIVVIGLLCISATCVGAYTSVNGIHLPDNSVTLNAVNGTTSYFIITLSGVPANLDVTNGQYPGWCADRRVTMLRATNHTVILYDSYDPALPIAFQGEWDKINWILNNRGSNSMMTIQNAFWYLLGDYTWNQLPTSSRNLILTANTSGGDGFVPQFGDILAIVCVPARGETDCQCSFIEIEIPEQGGCTYTPGYWKNHAVGPHADPTWNELPQGPNTVFHGNSYGFTWLSIMNFNAKQAKDLGLKWTNVRVYQHLAFHYVAAVLNGYNNGYLPSEINTLISGAKQIFTNNHNMILDNAETISALMISSRLAAFNEGTLYTTWPHCGD